MNAQVFYNGYPLNFLPTKSFHSSINHYILYLSLIMSNKTIEKIIDEM